MDEEFDIIDTGYDQGGDWNYQDENSDWSNFYEDSADETYFNDGGNSEAVDSLGEYEDYSWLDFTPEGESYDLTQDQSGTSGMEEDFQKSIDDMFAEFGIPSSEADDEQKQLFADNQDMIRTDVEQEFQRQLEEDQAINDARQEGSIESFWKSLGMGGGGFGGGGGGGGGGASKGSAGGGSSSQSKPQQQQQQQQQQPRIQYPQQQQYKQQQVPRYPVASNMGKPDNGNLLGGILGGLFGGLRSAQQQQPRIQYPQQQYGNYSNPLSSLLGGRNNSLSSNPSLAALQRAQGSSSLPFSPRVPTSSSNALQSLLKRNGGSLSSANSPLAMQNGYVSPTQAAQAARQAAVGGGSASKKSSQTNMLMIGGAVLVGALLLTKGKK